MSSTKRLLHRWFGLSADEHGGMKAVAADPDVSLEVINLGLSRTGTTSLSAAFEILGFAPTHQGIDLYRIPKRREYFIKLHEDLLAKKISTEDASERLQTIMQGYRSSNDHPISSTPAETVAAFPDAKYILSVRDGGRDAWWKSYNNAVGIHFRRGWDRTIFRTLISSVTFLRRIDDGVQVHGDRYTQQYGKDWFGPQLYGLHNEKVKSLLPKDKLLIYNVKQGWGPLCKYLGVPVPAQPFPFLNEQEAMKKIYFGMQAYGAFCWLLYGILAALPVHLAFHPSIVGSLLARLNARASLLLQSVR